MEGNDFSVCGGLERERGERKMCFVRAETDHVTRAFSIRSSIINDVLNLTISATFLLFSLM